MTEETDRDACRREVSARGLTPVAVGHLTRDALSRIELDHLAPVKKLLKRFFSDEPWSAADEAALAQLVGPGGGWWRHALDDDFVFDFGWRDGAFVLALERRALGDTFSGSVVPEATPNPRTIRFVTGPIHDGPSRWYASPADVDDPRVAQLFAEFDDVDNVLVGPDFVAIGLRRPDRWEAMLHPVLRAVAGHFTTTEDAGVASVDTPARQSTTKRESAPQEGRSSVERAWHEFGRLRADNPGDLQKILVAAAEPDVAVRQVAARLLVAADPDVAATTWEQLLADPSRSVRRATLDAIVDVDRPALRGLMEHALSDPDAWMRWKALRGIMQLGVPPSRAAVVPLVDDVDFRVRLEAAGALRADA